VPALVWRRACRSGCANSRYKRCVLSVADHNPGSLPLRRWRRRGSPIAGLDVQAVDVAVLGGRASRTCRDVHVVGVTMLVCVSGAAIDWAADRPGPPWSSTIFEAPAGTTCDPAIAVGIEREVERAIGCSARSRGSGWSLTCRFGSSSPDNMVAENRNTRRGRRDRPRGRRAASFLERRSYSVMITLVARPFGRCSVEIYSSRSALIQVTPTRNWPPNASVAGPRDARCGRRLTRSCGCVRRDSARSVHPRETRYSIRRK